jgi:aquaglyceroporin related protein
MSSSPIALVSHDEEKGHSNSSESETAAYAEHGAGIDPQITQDGAVQARPDLLWSRIRHVMREPFSEFFGVFILILFGDGVVAQVVLSGGQKGSYQSISWGWG